MSNKHTRKTFLAKVAAALAGLGLAGGARAAARTAEAASSTPAPGPSFAIQSDKRSVARTDSTL